MMRLGWILLASITALVRGNWEIARSIGMIALTVLFAGLMVVVARPILVSWARAALRAGNGELGLNALAMLFVLIFLAAIATNLIGIFAIFGAFLFGAVLSGEEEFRTAVARQLRNFVSVFFLPIFFTYTGLRTDIGTLETPMLWLLAAAVLFCAVLGKFGGCTLAARCSGMSTRDSVCGRDDEYTSLNGTDRSQRRL
jgi:Kef-type K+ transport system membrane component KefB